MIVTTQSYCSKIRKELAFIPGGLVIECASTLRSLERANTPYICDDEILNTIV